MSLYTLNLILTLYLTLKPILTLKHPHRYPHPYPHPYPPLYTQTHPHSPITLILICMLTKFATGAHPGPHPHPNLLSPTLLTSLPLSQQTLKRLVSSCLSRLLLCTLSHPPSVTHPLSATLTSRVPSVIHPSLHTLSLYSSHLPLSHPSLHPTPLSHTLYHRPLFNLSNHPLTLSHSPSLTLFLSPTLSHPHLPQPPLSFLPSNTHPLSPTLHHPLSPSGTLPPILTHLLTFSYRRSDTLSHPLLTSINRLRASLSRTLYHRPSMNLSHPATHPRSLSLTLPLSPSLSHPLSRSLAHPL